MVFHEHVAGVGLPRAGLADVGRDRLLRALDNASEAAALIFVRGPAGAGKTALLERWVRSRGIPYRRLSAKALLADGQPLRAHRFTAALRRAVSCTAAPAPVPGTRDQAAAAVAAAARVRSCGRAPAVAAAEPRTRLLVVDDFHLISPDLARGALLDFLQASPGLVIVAAGRALSELERDRALLSVETAVIGPEDLALTPRECETALEGTRLAGQGRAVHAATAGFLCWVRYLAIKAADGPGPIRRFDEFLDSAAAGLPERLVPPFQRPGMRAALLAASVPESFPEVLAAQLNPGLCGQELLSRAEQAGYLVRRRDGERAVVPLLRRSLLAALDREAPLQRQELERTCAEFFLAESRPLEALRHAVGSGSAAPVTAVLRACLPRILDRHPRGALAELQRIPALELARQPVPALVLGILLDRQGGSHRTRGAAMLGTAAAAAREMRRSVPPLPAAERFLLATVEAVALRLTGSLRKAARRASEALEIHTQAPLEERLRIGVLEASALAQLGLCLWRAGAAHEAETAFRLSGAAGATGATGAGRQEHWRSNLRALLRMLDGDTVGARSYLRQPPLRPLGPFEPRVRHACEEVPGRLVQALLALEALDSDRTREALAPLLRDVDGSEFWVYTRCCEAVADLLDGKASQAHNRLLGLASRRRDLPPIGCQEEERLTLVQSLLLLAMGRPAKALELLADLPAANPEVTLLTARAHLACSQPAEALSCLTRLDEAAQLSPAALAAAAGLGAAARLRMSPTSGTPAELAGLSAFYRDYGLTLATALLPKPDIARLKAAAKEANLPIGVPPGYAGVIPGSRPRVILTPREEVILHALAATGSIAEIAARNFVSTNTVKSQIRSLYRKLEVSDREAALTEASLRGLL